MHLILLTQEKDKQREVEVDLEQLKKAANDLHMGLMEEQKEKMQLKMMIRAGWSSRLELKESLEAFVVDVEATSVQNFIKTLEFKVAMARLNVQWYKACFEICTLQVRAELKAVETSGSVTVEILDRLNPKDLAGYSYSGEESFPKEFIPMPKSIKRPPLEMMKD
ncbi:hypothetical protein Dimus_003779 [Dionaea muscipula]